jgi:hypothetical protein
MPIYAVESHIGIDEARTYREGNRGHHGGSGEESGEAAAITTLLKYQSMPPVIKK